MRHSKKPGLAGTCQACQRLYRLRNGRIPAHGAVSLIGLESRECTGSWQSPYEESCEHLKAMLTYYRQQQESCKLALQDSWLSLAAKQAARQKIQQLDHSIPVRERQISNWSCRPLTHITTEDLEAHKQAERAAQEALKQAEQAERDAVAAQLDKRAAEKAVKASRVAAGRAERAARSKAHAELKAGWAKTRAEQEASAEARREEAYQDALGLEHALWVSKFTKAGRKHAKSEAKAKLLARLQVFRDLLATVNPIEKDSKILRQRLCQRARKLPKSLRREMADLTPVLLAKGIIRFDGWDLQAEHREYLAQKGREQVQVGSCAPTSDSQEADQLAFYRRA